MFGELRLQKKCYTKKKAKAITSFALALMLIISERTALTLPNRPQ